MTLAQLVLACTIICSANSKILLFCEGTGAEAFHQHHLNHRHHRREYHNLHPSMHHSRAPSFVVSLSQNSLKRQCQRLNHCNNNVEKSVQKTTYHPLCLAAASWTTIDWNQDRSRTRQDLYDFSPDDEQPSMYKVASYTDLKPTPSPKRPSPIEQILVRDRIVYVKRDDLLRLDRSNVSGNKSRKFLALNDLAVEDFPDAVVSYGGPQSNAMLALAAIVSSKNEQLSSNKDTRSDADNTGSKKKRFVYYTKKIPRWLRQQPSGNFMRAKSLGMEIVELSPARYSELFGGESGGSSTPPEDLDPPQCIDGIDGDMSCLWIPQGGACGIAQKGTEILALEIVEFWIREGRGRPLAVVLPGGTCSTALLLHRQLKYALAKTTQQIEPPMDIEVVVVPCVGDDEYALRQMSGLAKSLGGDGSDVPVILKPLKHIKQSSYSNGSSNRRMKGKREKGYFTFGTPHPALLETYNEMMQEHSMFLDLLYGAPAWNVILQHWNVSNAYGNVQNENVFPLAERQVMYVHSGGLEGIASQMTRYKREGMVDPANVQ